MIISDGVTKSYSTSSRPTPDDVSVRIDKGEFVSPIRSSGPGKSTSLRLMVCEKEVDSGKLTVADRGLIKISRRNIPKLRQKVGYVFQDFRLLPKKTVYENVVFAPQVIGRSKTKTDKAIPEALEMAGLSGKENHYPHELSGGEQQRIAITHASVNRPLALLADEPTGNLDPSTSGDIMFLLGHINRIGTTVIVSTHDNDVVDSMHRRVLEPGLGCLVRDGTTGIYGPSNQQTVHQQKNSFEEYY